MQDRSLAVKYIIVAIVTTGMWFVTQRVRTHFAHDQAAVFHRSDANQEFTYFSIIFARAGMEATTSLRALGLSLP